MNEAFLLDSPTRDRLIADDPGCSRIINQYLRGQDVSRWAAEWGGMWLVQLASSGDQLWPWTGASEIAAEAVFRHTFPSLHAFMKPRKVALRKPKDQGRFWWELRACACYAEFAKPKVVYQEIQFHPSCALDESGSLLNNKASMITTPSPWLLAVLNSPLMWWFNWRYLPHMKDEALSPKGKLLENLPIANPTAAQAKSADRRHLGRVHGGGAQTEAEEHGPAFRGGTGPSSKAVCGRSGAAAVPASYQDGT